MQSKQLLNGKQSDANCKQHYDFIIAGGGMAGATSAIALAQLGFSIALIEAVEPKRDISASFDQRAVALSASSVAIFQSLGIWPLLKNIACSIKEISVSDQGNFGFTRLNAKDYQVEALGEVIPLELTGPILWNIIEAEENITVFCPAKVISVEKNQAAKNSSASETPSLTETNLPAKYNSYSCNLAIQPDNLNNSENIQLTCRLLLAADGTYSQIANALNIEYSRESYQQHALIANIITELPHNNRAFERFTPSGPLALLPLTEAQTNSSAKNKTMSLVWCFKPEEIESAINWSDDFFIQQLQQAFGFRLGKILKVGKRVSYPLSLHIAKQAYLPGVLLLGNAAHTLHPIAGQGFNLGLRDIASFVEQVEQCFVNNQDFGSEAFLAGFVNSRQQDWQQTILATDSLVRLFSNQFLPLVFSRNKAMNIINQIPFFKKQIALSAMGFKTRSSKLARGFSLKKIKANKFDSAQHNECKS